MECLVYRELVKRIEALEEQVARLTRNNETDWYDIKGLCEKYHLPINHIKSRKWRLENSFPTYQDGPYCRVAFKGSSVEKWIEEKLNRL